MSKSWQGAEYLVAGNGYRIVLDSLDKYAERLQNLGKGSELNRSGAFGVIIQQAANKRLPMTQRTIQEIKQFLIGKQSAKSLTESIPVIISALECYEAEIKELHNSSNLDQEQKNAIQNKLQAINNAKIKIGCFVD